MRRDRPPGGPRFHAPTTPSGPTRTTAAAIARCAVLLRLVVSGRHARRAVDPCVSKRKVAGSGLVTNGSEASRARPASPLPVPGARRCAIAQPAPTFMPRTDNTNLTDCGYGRYARRDRREKAPQFAIHHLGCLLVDGMPRTV